MHVHGYVSIQTDINIGRHAQDQKPVLFLYSISVVGVINFHDAKGIILL